MDSLGTGRAFFSKRKVTFLILFFFVQQQSLGIHQLQQNFISSTWLTGVQNFQKIGHMISGS